MIRTAGALAGLRVLDLGGSGAAVRAGALLADHGADVVAVRPHGVDPRFDRSRRTICRTLSDVVLDDLASRAQVVLDGRPGAAATAWLDRAARNAVACRLPAFPAGHPLAEAQVPDVLVDAAAGAFDPPLGHPVLHPLAVGAGVAAAYAACAVAASAIGAPDAIRPRWIEIPMFDAALHAQELRAMLTLDAPRHWQPLQWAATPFVATWRCADGRWLHLHTGLPHHLDRFVAALRRLGCEPAAAALDAASAATRADPTRVASVREAAAIRRLLAALFAERPAETWERDLGESGVCAVLCRTAEEWRAHPQAAGQGSSFGPGVVPSLSDTPGAVRASREVDPSDLPWPRTADAPRATHPPLAGFKVLDLAQIIAAPAAARTLMWLGADVTKLVNPRRESGFVPAFRSLYDGGKNRVRADLTTNDGRALLARWFAWGPDVVIHNLTPSAAERLGVTAGIRTVPGAIEARVSAFGTTGPWAGRPGLEQSAQAATGVQVAYGGERPDLVPIPASDLVTGLLVAFGAICGLVHRDRTGVAQTVEGTLSATCAWLGTTLPEAPITFGRTETRGRELRHGGEVSVPRAGLRRLLGSRLRRALREAGPITEVLAPWHGAGLAQASPETPEDPAPSGPGRARWVVRTAPWAVYLAATRL